MSDSLDTRGRKPNAQIKLRIQKYPDMFGRGLKPKIVVSSIAVAHRESPYIYVWHNYQCTAMLSAVICWIHVLFRARSNKDMNQRFLFKVV